MTLADVERRFESRKDLNEASGNFLKLECMKYGMEGRDLPNECILAECYDTLSDGYNLYEHKELYSTPKYAANVHDLIKQKVEAAIQKCGSFSSSSLVLRRSAIRLLTLSELSVNRAVQKESNQLKETSNKKQTGNACPSNPNSCVDIQDRGGTSVQKVFGFAQTCEGAVITVSYTACSKTNCKIEKSEPMRKGDSWNKYGGAMPTIVDVECRSSD